MPEQSKIHKRYADAQAEARTAEAARDQAISRDSSALLRNLKGKSVARRFEALADPDLNLTQAHRRELVKSIRGTASDKPTTTILTATRWEVWRSRLRYRLFFVGATGVAVTTTVILIAIANHRTPEQWVTISSAQAFIVQRTASNGQAVPARIDPGTRYAAIQFAAGQVQLRDWEPATGYATFWIPRALLAPAP